MAFGIGIVLTPVWLAAFWVAVSYVVMVAGWILGLGDLHPFPRLILMPGSNDCWPYHDGPC